MASVCVPCCAQYRHTLYGSAPCNSECLTLLFPLVAGFASQRHIQAGFALRKPEPVVIDRIFRDVACGQHSKPHTCLTT
eukprot:364786-Chlamydomonas_euryale.AAC.21